jgi:hypothetical protein
LGIVGLVGDLYSSEDFPCKAKKVNLLVSRFSPPVGPKCPSNTIPLGFVIFAGIFEVTLVKKESVRKRKESKKQLNTK